MIKDGNQEMFIEFEGTWELKNKIQKQYSLLNIHAILVYTN